MTPSSVDHAIAFSGLGQACLLEINVPQALEARWIRDMSAGGLRGRSLVRYQ